MYDHTEPPPSFILFVFLSHISWYMDSYLFTCLTSGEIMRIYESEVHLYLLHHML
jgi:hypothetical protein